MKNTVTTKLNWTYFVILICSFSLQAQNVTFEHYLRAEGLSNNSVRAICQDSSGFLWFGTLNGLNKYDGVSFHKYFHNYNSTSSLTSDRIYKLKNDSVGNMWIISYDGKVKMYNKTLNIFDNILTYTDSSFIKNIQIKDIYISGTNELYLISRDRGCIKVVTDANKIISATHLHIGNVLPNNKVNFIFKGKNNTTWIGTNKGLTILNSKNSPILPKYHYRCYCKTDSLYLFGTQYNNIIAYNYIKNEITELDLPGFNNHAPINDIKYFNNSLFIATYGEGFTYFTHNKCVKYNIDNTKNLHSNIIFPVYIDRCGIIWLETASRGVSQFDPNTQKVKYFSLNAKERESLGDPEKIIFFEDSNQDLWLGIYGGGLCKYNRNLNSFEQYTNHPTNSETLSSNYVLTLFEDNCNDLWIGTLNGGINKLKLKKQPFKLIQPHPNSQTITDNEIRSIYSDSRNHIWTGTKSGKLHCYDSSFNLLLSLPDDIPSFKDLTLKNIYTLMEDHNHNLWVGTKGEGIFIFKDLISKVNTTNLTNINYIHLKRNPHQYNTLGSDNIYDLLEVNDSTVWVATHSGGLSVIHNPLKKYSFTNYISNSTQTNSISSNNLRCLFKDNAGNIWIGSASGLNFVSHKYIDSNQIHFKVFRSQTKDTVGLNNDDIICIHQNKTGTLYCGTFGGGVNYIKGEDLKNKNFAWQKITIQNGLSSNVIYKILENKNNGEIWVSTDYGINKLNSEFTPLKTYFPENKASRSNIYTENTGTYINENTFIFGHLNGTTSFSPDSIHTHNREYPTCITKLKVNEEKIEISTENFNDNQIIYKTPNAFKHTQNYLTFNFAVLDYGVQDKIKYAYMLQNFEDNWNYTDNTNSATYKRLPPGKYTFKVKGTNSAGKWNNKQAVMHITILPPWWKTIYAFIGYFIIILLIIMMIRILMLKQLNLKNTLKLEQISTNNKLNFYTNISHELKTPLTLIKGPAEDIINKNNVNEEVRTKAGEILKNTKRILGLVNQLIEFRKVQEGHLQLSVHKVNITAFFQDIHEAFKTLSVKDNIIFDYISEPTEIVGYIDTDKIEKITFNLISNAFKHTPKGKKITLKTELFEDHLKIAVIDQGKGIPKDKTEQIFENYAWFSNPEKSFDSSSGIGLSLAKELVKIHKGKIIVNSKPGSGSTFTVYVPINETSYSKNEITESSPKLSNTNFIALKEIKQNDKDIISNKRSAGADAPNVLLIEDNAELRSYLLNNLKSFYKVTTAKNGKEGIELALKTLPDIIISDVMMPTKDGLELTKELKTKFNTCHIPIILLTAMSTTEQIQSGYENGADDYITKPFSFPLLKTRINNLIEQRKKLEFRLQESKHVQESSVNLTDQGKDTLFISQVTKYTEQHMSDTNFNINSIVKEFNYGRSVFYKKIKTLTGHTPTEFVKTIRMKHAAKSLKNTQKAVNEISSMVGYSDSDYFCRAFKKHFGVTPSDYRNKNKVG